MNKISLGQLRELDGKFVMFGVTNMSDFVRDMGITPLCYCDDDSSLWTETFGGLSVLPREKVLDEYGASVPIFLALTSKMSFSSVSSRLQDNGFKNIMVCDDEFLSAYPEWKKAQQSRLLNLAGISIDGLLPEEIISHLGRAFGNNISFERMLRHTQGCQGRGKNSVIIPFITQTVTTKCTLNCRFCALMVPTMRSCSEAYDRKLEDLKEDMEAMLQVADVVWQYDFCGGETFLYDNDALAYLVDKACGAPKVLSVLLVTNGTIIPTEGLLKSLGHSKVSVFVSNYGELSSQYSALVGLFQERGIKHTPRGREGDEAWRDFGLHDTKRERPDKFHCEAMFGTSLIDGRLYRCGVSAFMSRLGFVKENPAEYIQVRGRDPRDIRAELSSFYAQTYLSACDYCDGVTGTPVKAAEQCAIS